jgi:hypothetical protein
MVTSDHNKMIAKHIKKERPELERFLDTMNCVTGFFWIHRKNHGRTIAWVNSAMNIIIPAAVHPSKAFEFFDTDFDILGRVQSYTGPTMENFTITSLSRNDISTFLADELELMELAVQVKKLTDSDMKHLTNDMASDYLEQLYWNQLRTLPMEKLKALLELSKCEHGTAPECCPDCSICGRCRKRHWCDYSTYGATEPVPGPLEDPYNETCCDDLEEGEPIPKED